MGPPFTSDENQQCSQYFMRLFFLGASRIRNMICFSLKLIKSLGKVLPKLRKKSCFSGKGASKQSVASSTKDGTTFIPIMDDKQYQNYTGIISKDTKLYSLRQSYSTNIVNQTKKTRSLQHTKSFHLITSCFQVNFNLFVFFCFHSTSLNHK